MIYFMTCTCRPWIVSRCDFILELQRSALIVEGALHVFEMQCRRLFHLFMLCYFTVSIFIYVMEQGVPIHCSRDLKGKLCSENKWTVNCWK